MFGPFSNYFMLPSTSIHQAFAESATYLQSAETTRGLRCGEICVRFHKFL
jgi:hypothetical protein